MGVIAAFKARVFPLPREALVLFSEIPEIGSVGCTTMSENMTFSFWDRYMHLEEEELKLFNFVLQFDFGEGNGEYSCEQLKAAGVTVRQALGCLRFIICGYNDGSENFLALNMQSQKNR